MDKAQSFILWFDQLGIEDVPFVGGKNASLGEMYRLLTPKGIRVPNGFAVTAYAYQYLIDKTGVRNQIKDILKDLNTSNIQNLQERGHKVRDLIRHLEFPPELRAAILEAYRNLCGTYSNDRKDVDVAVRSSATAEDLPDASFAGQQETYLNIKGENAVIDACKKCFASLFTDRAISYRFDKKFDHFLVSLSIGVQKMVRSDMACSGVAFSIDTESGFRDVAFLTASYGLGENIVQGAVNPDEYYVHKPTLAQGFRPIISKKIGSKEIKMIYDLSSTKASTKNVPVPESDRNKFALNDDEIIELARWVAMIEQHYSEKAGYHKPMDIEWAKDGQTNQLFIVQARPETVQARKNQNTMETYELTEKSQVLITGRSVGDKIGTGPVNVIKSVHDISKFKKGEVLVTEITDPDWEPIMKIASAIITNRGGRTCHAAIISRELGIPCIVGTKDATEVLKSGAAVTVDCSGGEVGRVWQGALKFVIKKANLAALAKTRTKVMINVGDPSQAFAFAQLPCAGVGLAREEFVLNEHIAVHPMAILHPEKVTRDVTEKILAKARGYANPRQFYVDKLAEGIGMIAAAFFPRPVIVRMTDFKTNEYANLLGGQGFEPVESNPMIGWRGASRYYDEKYKEAFAMECESFKKVRNVFGLKNVKIMIPMVRTLDEGRLVIDELRKNGLERGKDGLEVISMCEVPSNVLCADQFLDMFDGFSIGSNDLTQMTLAVDRDSELVSHVFNERNPAIYRLLQMVIEVSNRRKKYLGICGQAPSDYPEFTEFLVQNKIESISLNPDVFLKTLQLIVEYEKKYP